MGAGIEEIVNSFQAIHLKVGGKPLKFRVWAGAAAVVAGLATAGRAQTVDAKVCDVINHPKNFDGKTVRLTGLVQADFDSFIMRGDTCSNALWLSYPAGTKAKSGPAAVVTLQLASNATGTPGTARPALTLERTKDFDTFDLLLSQKPKTNGMCLGCVKNDVMATLVGRIDGTDNPGLVKDKNGKITSLDGFGNMNMYLARMVITSVSDVSAKEIDFSRAPKIDGDSQGGGGKDYVGLAKKGEEAFPKGSPAVKTIEDALAALGAPGQDNGVVVGFGDVANVPDGDGTKGAKASPDGLLPTIKIDMDKLKGEALGRAIGHEATKVEALRESEVRSCRRIETDAWQTVLLITIGSRQKSLTIPGGYVIWSDSWSASDKGHKGGEVVQEYLADRDETPK